MLKVILNSMWWHADNLSTVKAETGGWQVLEQPSLYRSFLLQEKRKDYFEDVALLVNFQSVLFYFHIERWGGGLLARFCSAFPAAVIKRRVCRPFTSSARTKRPM